MLPNAFVTDVQQVALIVRDLDATIEEYADRLGIGPWRVINCEPPRLTDMRVRGESVPYSMKLAVARTGNTMWEIIEPVDGPSIYQEFLDERGEGLHHLIVDHDGLDYDEALALFTERGCPPVMEGCLDGIRYAYVETEGPLKTTFEIVHRPEGRKPTAPDYWYPAPPA